MIEWVLRLLLLALLTGCATPHNNEALRLGYKTCMADPRVYGYPVTVQEWAWGFRFSPTPMEYCWDVAAQLTK
jgi:hypothetical protein